MASVRSHLGKQSRPGPDAAGKNDLFAHGGVSVEHVGVERFILVIVIPVAQRYLWNLINYLLRDHSGGIVVIVDFGAQAVRTCRST